MYTNDILISPLKIDNNNSLFDKWLASWLKTKKNHPNNRPTLRIERVKEGLKYLNIDLKKFKNIIHITGSTGKGTTAIIIGGILRSLNLNVGVVVKPHLAYSVERCIINDKFIDENTQIKYLNQLTDFNHKYLSNSSLGDFKYTEIMFLSSLACLYRYNKILDYIIIEAGTGIKYDYTNVFNGHQSYFKIITKIEKNHTKRLGNTVQKIFDDKNYNWLNTKKTIYLFPDDNIKYPKGSKKFYAIKKQKFSIRSRVTGGIIKFSNTKIFTNLIIPEHLYTLGVSIQALTKLDKILSKKIEDTILKKDTNIYINLPARFMPYFFKTEKLTSIIDNAHAINQYKNLIKNLKSIKNDYNIDIHVLMQFFGSKRQNDTLKLLKDEYINYSFFKIIPPRGIKLTVNKNAINFTKLKTFDKNKLLVFTGSVYSTGQILKFVKYNTHPYQKDAINNAIYAQKQLVRFLYKNKRNTLSTNQYNKYSQKYISNIKDKLTIILQESDIIVGFIPFNKEINILPLLKELDQKGKKIILPLKTKNWALAEIKRLNSFLQGKILSTSNKDNRDFKKISGIYQPTKANIYKIFTNIKDLTNYYKGKKILVFLPGLVFTPKGDRIGYGGGIYDKLLKDVKYIHIDGFYNTFYSTEDKDLTKPQDKQNNLIYTKRYNEQKSYININGNPWGVYKVITVPVRYPWELEEFVVDFIK